jgi:ribosomal protein L6P/L9E
MNTLLFQNLFLSQSLKIPSGIVVQKNGHLLKIQGPLGSFFCDLSRLDPSGAGVFRLNSDPQDPQIQIFVRPEQKAWCGSMISFFRKHFEGVSQGYLITLECVGVGYRALVRTEASKLGISRSDLTKNERLMREYVRPDQISKADSHELKVNELTPSKVSQILELKLGQSHELLYELPENVRVFSLKPSVFCLYGIDLQQIQQIAAELRRLKPPEPYKGKGIRRQDEILRLREGKKK